jgi:hypothetical protein
MMPEPVKGTPVPIPPKEDKGLGKAKTTQCPISRKQFIKVVSALDLGKLLQGRFAAPKEFDSGSFGWFFNDKVTVELDGKLVKVQPTISLTVVGSKNAPDE